MGLPVVRIHYCAQNCMLYWDADSELEHCKFCRRPQFKLDSRDVKGRLKKKRPFKEMFYFPIIPRLQRLYQSNATAKDMTWHTRCSNDHFGVMRHPANSQAWKLLDQSHPEFASEIQNVRLGLSTDTFQPFGAHGKQYSSLPVIVTPYNLSPWLCMKDQFMFLTALVPGTKNPKDKLDVFLQPLIRDLIFLWEHGVVTYDVVTKQNFMMRAALIWTISDFPACSMLSGWSIAGRLACPYCADYTKAFSLRLSRKQSWFDNHRKFLDRCHPYRRNKTAFRKNVVVDDDPPSILTSDQLLQQIDWIGLMKVTELCVDAHNKGLQCGWKKKKFFWDLLYWSSLLIKHNLDVMHIEKNMFDNLFYTVMNVEGKTKDTTKSRDELNEYYRRPSLQKCPHIGKYPKASYSLDKKHKDMVCKWVDELKFPDDYVSNLSQCVYWTKLKMFGMKNHDLLGN